MLGVGEDRVRGKRVVRSVPLPFAAVATPAALLQHGAVWRATDGADTWHVMDGTDTWSATDMGATAPHAPLSAWVACGAECRAAARSWYW